VEAPDPHGRLRSQVEEEFQKYAIHRRVAHHKNCVEVGHIADLMEDRTYTFLSIEITLSIRGAIVPARAKLRSVTYGC